MQYRYIIYPSEGVPRGLMIPEHFAWLGLYLQ
jgi:hypothetical protein